MMIKAVMCIRFIHATAVIADLDPVEPTARQAHGDARAFLRRQYRPSWIKRVLGPWARTRWRSRRRDISCNHVDCACIWCRCAVPH